MKEFVLSMICIVLAIGVSLYYMARIVRTVEAAAHVETRLKAGDCVQHQSDAEAWEEPPNVYKLLQKGKHSYKRAMWFQGEWQESMFNLEFYDLEFYNKVVCPVETVRMK